MNDQIIQAKNYDISDEKSNIREKMKKVEAVVDDAGGDGTVVRVLKLAKDNLKKLNPTSKDKEINIKKH